MYQQGGHLSSGLAQQTNSAGVRRVGNAWDCTPIYRANQQTAFYSRFATWSNVPPAGFEPATPALGLELFQ